MLPINNLNSFFKSILKKSLGGIKKNKRKTIVVSLTALAVGGVFSTLYCEAKRKDNAVIEKKIDIDNVKESLTSEQKKIKESRIYRAPGMKLDDPLITEVIPGKKSMAEVFTFICKSHIGKVAYLSRRIKREYIERDLSKNIDVVTKEFGKVEKLTYGELYSMVLSIASALKQWVPKSKTSERPKIGIFLETRKEWMMIAQASWLCNYSIVTCYSSLGVDALVSIVNETEMNVLVVNSSTIKFIDDNLFQRCKSLKKIITVGNSNYISKNFEQKNIYDLLLEGERIPNISSKDDTATKDDIALLMYTSGTTKKAKGVVLTHHNLMSAVGGYSKEFTMRTGDVYLSYLPLAHIYELVVHLVAFQYGDGEGVAFGSPRTLVAKKGAAKYIGDLQAFRPTVLIGVPRVFEGIKKGIQNQVKKQSYLKKQIFNTFLKKRINHLKNGENKSVMFEKLAFGRIRELVGGRLRLVISGGAPLSENSHLFLQAVLGSECNVVTGFGLSETGAVACVEDTTKFGIPNNVGRPNRCCEIKVSSEPEMGYFAGGNLPEGEILIRGGNVCSGYYKRDDLNKTAFTEDGFFRTGDIGRIFEDGTLQIIDRKKSLIKLQCAEYISCTNLESFFGSNSEWVTPNGIVLHVNPLKNDIVAIIIINQNHLKSFTKSRGMKRRSIRETLNDPKIKKAVMDDFTRLAKEKKLKYFEYIKNVFLTTDEFSPENGMLTSSNKIKRRAVEEKYAREISIMFDELQNKNKSKEDKKKPKSKYNVPKYYYQLNPEFEM